MGLTLSTEDRHMPELPTRDDSQDFAPGGVLVERPEDGIFVLPGGFIDDRGEVHREVELAPVTGKEEQLISETASTVPTAVVVTRLLVRCVKRIGSLFEVSPQIVRNLLVGDRDYLILRLRALTFGDTLDAVLQCPNLTCAKPMDLQLRLSELMVEQKPIAQRFFDEIVTVAGTIPAGRDQRPALREVEFRLPTGADQETLAEIAQTDPIRATRQLLARCLRRVGKHALIDAQVLEKIPLAVLQAIEAKMQQRAPQVNIDLEGVCPECQKSFSVPFDITRFFLAEMCKNSQNLYREIHFLAWHYHWPEREILALTRVQRHRYLVLLNEEIESE